MTAYQQDADAGMTTLDASNAELQSMHWNQLIDSEQKALENLQNLQAELAGFDNGILQNELISRIAFLQKIQAQADKRHYY